MNNNNPKYFYLHNDHSLDVDQSYVTTLRVSIALKSELHYQTLLNAKKTELTSEFTAKLGWLAGNLYSRVGTQDWTPDNFSNQDFKDLTTDIIENNFAFVQDIKEYAKLYSLTNVGMSIENLSQDDFLDFVSNYKLPRKRMVFQESVKQILLNEGIEEKQQKKILAKILSDSKIAAMLK